MSIETTEDALAFIEASKLMFEGKTGFKHYAKQLADLQAFIEKLADENEELIARINFASGIAHH